MDTEDIFRLANAAYDAGNLTDAFSLFLQAAEQDDCNAMCRVAAMYESGEGTDLDIEKSIYWDLKAIDFGNNTSMLNLGITYRRIGDIRAAKHWFEKALATGDGEAALELAKLNSISNKEIATVKHYLDIAITSDRLSQASLEEVENLLKMYDI